MDSAAIFLMITYIVIFVQRTILDIFDGMTQGVFIFIECLNPITSIASYGLLYFFVFEMLTIVATLRSNFHCERRIQYTNIRRMRIIIYTLLFFFYFPITMWIYVMSRASQ